MLNTAPITPLIAEMPLEVLLDGPVTHIALEELVILHHLWNMSIKMALTRVTSVTKDVTRMYLA